jgi:hypothetical protein
MKPVPRILIAATSLVAVAVVGLAVAAPKHYDVSRSIVIDRDAHDVFAYTARLDTRREWTSWAEKDPGATWTVTGRDGAPGAEVRWQGEQAGEGKVTIEDVQADRRIATHLTITKPFQAESSDTFEIERLGDQKTRVTWKNEGDLHGPMRLFGFVADRVLGDDYARGLANLKAKMEQPDAGARRAEATLPTE